MKFTKMHGCGNDYIYVDCVNQEVTDRAELSRRVSDVHFGIGSDGLICICPSDRADFKMDMYNADGSRAQMCGNGIRCVAKYVYDRGMTDKTTLTVETLSGVRTLWLNVDNGAVASVRVCMGKPDFTPASVPVLTEKDRFVDETVTVAGRDWRVTALSVGNPHAVVFTSGIDALNLSEIGSGFENNPIFPERINTEFVEVIDRKTLKMRVWERGSGETLACGTGASASLAAAVLTGRCDGSAEVRLRGGTLRIEWDRKEDMLYMTGPAEFICDGELLI